MHYEVEQKFPLADPAAVQAGLAALGAQFQPPIEQVDLYFRHPSRDFAKTDEALRLRQIGEQNFITYKGPKIDPSTKTRRELELPLPGGDEAHQKFTELLTTLSFLPVATVKKRRSLAEIHWEGFRVECALDDVDGAGKFIELEISADDSSLASARQSLANISDQLDLKNPERRSYLELIYNNPK
jgi:adenylate cyclase class 2